MTKEEIAKINLRELKDELLRRVLLQEMPTYALVAELARREESGPKPGGGIGSMKHQRFRKFCAEQFEMSVAELTGPRKPKNVADARTVSMAVAHKVLSASTTEIAKLFGRVDHSSVFHAKNAAEKRSDLRSAALDLEARWYQVIKKESKKK